MIILKFEPNGNKKRQQKQAHKQIIETKKGRDLFFWRILGKTLIAVLNVMKFSIYMHIYVFLYSISFVFYVYIKHFALFISSIQLAYTV